RAFPAGDIIAIAIDPGANPGAEADVYITTARTAEEWQSAPALVDVRGAPQTVTFPGPTIQANTTVLTGSATLDSDAGTGLGVGYDLVCDFNGNAVLDAGDFIDGFGDEAGFYVVSDLTVGGPLPVTEVTYTVSGVTPGFTGQNTYYPTGIATMGRLPLITISHGNGHNYTWYDYLGNHLASYGFVVMSHQNNTGPGIETASTTTYEHTDAFLGQLGSIAGGALVGHIDTTRILWIGHSRGGEGVARAYTRVENGSVVPENYEADDIVFVSSIAPNNSLGPGATQPREVNYHLLWGAADGDISGSGSSTGTWSFAIFERAEGFRQSTYVHGADHNDFNCCGFEDFTGPAGTAIGRPEAQRVAKAVYLAAAQRYANGNIPALDLFWRQWERYRPIGVSPATVVVNDYREGDAEGRIIIDDFQTGTDLGMSSSGGAVTWSVDDETEGVLRDVSSGYTWTGSDPMNGMSRAVGSDDPFGVVFGWNADRFLEFEIVEALRDFTDDEYLAFRACQVSHHPNTVAVLADLTFTATLRDGAGATSSIRIGAYGGGIEELYQRSGGWQNEFEVIRIRLTDFLHNGSGLDLSDIAAIRFEFGPSHGSAEGYIGFDELMLSSSADPPTPGTITVELADEVPMLIPPGVETTLTLVIGAASEDVVAGSPTLHYRFDGGDYLTAPLAALGGDLYEATVPAAGCGDVPEFYFSAEGSLTGEIRLPIDAPATVFTTEVGTLVEAFSDDFESDLGWTVVNIDLEDGPWERGVPAGDGERGDPTVDWDGSGACYLTDNVAGNSDVDGGPTIVTSPRLDATTLGDPRVGYARWFTNDDEDIDRLIVELSNNDGGTWTVLEEVPNTVGWVYQSWRIADFMTPTDQMRIRFSAIDQPNDSVTEAGVDAISIFEITCP
ncbi:MAG: hypothetical protein KJO43_01235, partial [Phycisphaerae bacterium]|nr:hypothetical protein [Phycisphaerae bacterium]